MDRDQWLAARREVPHSVGASEVSSILGGAWGGPHEVWARRVLGREPPQHKRLEGGHGAERYVAAWAVETLRLEQPKYGFVAPWVARDPEAPWAACSPDLLGCQGGCRTAVELKTSESPVGWPRDGRVEVEELPHGYGWQCLWQFGVLRVDRVYLAAWLGAGAHFWRTYQVQATKAQYLEARDRVETWRDLHLVRELEPPGDPRQELEAARLLAQPTDTPPAGGLDQAAAVEAWLDARAAESGAILTRERQEARLLRACPAGATFSDGVLTIGRDRRPRWSKRK